jgi:hypothetical protein
MLYIYPSNVYLKQKPGQQKYLSSSNVYEFWNASVWALICKGIEVKKAEVKLFNCLTLKIRLLNG